MSHKFCDTLDRSKVSQMYKKKYKKDFGGAPGVTLNYFSNLMTYVQNNLVRHLYGIFSTYYLFKVKLNFGQLSYFKLSVAKVLKYL